MSGRNRENLEELFRQFGDEEQAKRAAEDIYKAEEILSENPAPEPDGKLITDIKAEIAGALLRRQSNAFRQIAYKATAVAAVFIILTAIGLKVFEQGGGGPERLTTASIIPRAIWESDCLADDDADLAILTAEIEQIQAEVMALQLGGNGGNGSKAIMELEMKLIEINSDFWKG